MSDQPGLEGPEVYVDWEVMYLNATARADEATDRLAAVVAMRDRLASDLAAAQFNVHTNEYSNPRKAGAKIVLDRLDEALSAVRPSATHEYGVYLFNEQGWTRIEGPR